MKLPQMLPLILLFLSCLEGSSGKKSKESSEKVQPSFPWAQSGQFSTSNKHLCTWQLVFEEGASELQLTCHSPGEDGSRDQQCVYRGQPERCAAYSSKGRQFWKQILGKLRKKQHPCQETSPLKSRLCSGKKGGSEAQLHLVVTTLSTDAPVTTEGTTKGKPKGKGRSKDPPALQKASRDRGQGSPVKSDAPDKRNKGGRRKGSPNSSVAPTQTPPWQLTAVVEGSEQPTELNADVVEAYCEEKWHSLCNFFVNFWNG
ncbi:fibroblast growth factor-binding protein 3 [Sceloporus undulatus]|uniref:fibroblast growth factor-binding protein 3 n=1 Tax=Sceloporus undulatus TaxID=8520 RepID=UPI001C4CBD00|nr:fibroblast growth factor-binding protein 3 [Sceloporus undulatus]